MIQESHVSLLRSAQLLNGVKQLKELLLHNVRKTKESYSWQLIGLLLSGQQMKVTLLGMKQFAQKLL